MFCAMFLLYIQTHNAKGVAEMSWMDRVTINIRVKERDGKLPYAKWNNHNIYVL